MNRLKRWFPKRTDPARPKGWRPEQLGYEKRPLNSGEAFTGEWVDVEDYSVPVKPEKKP